MRPINPKRLVASAIIYLFTSMSTPMLADAVPDVVAAVPSQQESVLLAQAPSIDVSAPRVVDLQYSGATAQAFQAGDKAIISCIDFLYNRVNDLKRLPFWYGEEIIEVISSAYPNTPGGFVNLSSSDLQTGFLKIEKPLTTMEQHLRLLLAAPEKFQVRSDVLNVQLGPKIITDSATRTSLLAMEPWDFRLVAEPKYTEVAINQMFTNAYSTFKAFAQSKQKQDPQALVTIHTSYWGANYKNNTRLTTAIQFIAASLAGVQKIIFHGNDTRVIADAEAFVKAQTGKNVGDVLQSLLQQSTHPQWMAGVEVV